MEGKNLLKGIKYNNIILGRPRMSVQASLDRTQVKYHYTLILISYFFPAPFSAR